MLVAVDVFHALGLGLANAGDLGERLAKSVTQSPLALLDWAAGALAIVWLLRRNPTGSRSRCWPVSWWRCSAG